MDAILSIGPWEMALPMELIAAPEMVQHWAAQHCSGIATSFLILQPTFYPTLSQIGQKKDSGIERAPF